MEQIYRHRKKYNNLFNPNNQGLSTYDLTLVTATNNKKKTEELLLNRNKQYQNSHTHSFLRS